jgi:hypothetical protein
MSSISFYKLSETIKSKSFDENLIIKPAESFLKYNSVNPEYVEPRFSILESTESDFTKSKIFLISAAGATGKSALSQHLSAKNNIPTLDLAKHLPVGGDSLSGLFWRVFGANGTAKFITDLGRGETAVMIDAIDEGRAKTSEDAFMSFLDNIVEYASQSESTSFIILGRTQVLENTFLHLYDKGISVTLLKIEPFTIDQAKEFIDKKVKADTKEYRDIRDYIIESIGGFFTKIGDIETATYESFIGYAPVLKSISTLLKEEKNYHKLLGDLMNQDDKGLDLIIKIVEQILLREKNEKVNIQILPELIKSFEEGLKKDLMSNAFNIEEQSVRIICQILNRQPSIRHTSNDDFNSKYEEKINSWIEEHPFISSGNIQNPVFEAYIIATLFNSHEFNSLAQEYIAAKYKDNYLLFFIFDKIVQSRTIPIDFIQYLYASIKSIDDKNNYSITNIEAGDFEEGNEVTNCDVEFNIYNHRKGKIEKSFEYSTDLNSSSNIRFYGFLDKINIDVPCTFTIYGKKAGLFAPSSIRAKKVIVKSHEILLDRSTISSPAQNENIFVECDEFFIDYFEGYSPSLKSYVNEEDCKICSPIVPQYPFSQFHKIIGLSNIDPELKQKYIRLRRIIMTLRSHSKGTLARYKDKIEHRRVLKNQQGQSILDKMIEVKILLLVGKMYHWNPEIAGQILGISWVELRQMEITEKTKQFLKNIK